MRNTKRINDDDPSNDTVRLLEKLAMTNLKLMHFETAEKFYSEALDMADQLFKFDTEIGSVTEEDALYNIASIHFKKGNLNTAKETLANIIRKSKKNGPNIDPKIHNLIGMIYFSEERYYEARIYFDKAFKGTKNVENFPNRQKIHILYNLGNASNQITYFDDALDYFNWAVEEVDNSNFGAFDKKIEHIRLYTKIGHSHFNLGNLGQAYEYYTKAYILDENLFKGEKRETVMELRRYIGVTRSHQGQFDDALFIFDEILYSHKSVDWPDGIIVGKVLLDMSEIYYVCGSTHLSQEHQFKLAISCCKRAFDIFSHSKLREDHPCVQQGNVLKTLIRQEFPEV
uniref:MalT-like TPR region domain-containing protein n=1 Tax=Eucampia antarctica TaxID=49252 RepID=A0A7S2RXW3_9STRA